MKKKENDEEEKENEKEEKVITSNDFEIKFIGNLKDHKGPITSLVCSEDEKNEKYIPLLFSGSEDNTIIKWKLFFKNGEFEVNKDSEENKELILGNPENIISEHNDFITCY